MTSSTLQKYWKHYTSNLLALFWIGLVLVFSWKNTQHYLYLADFSLNQLTLLLFPLIVYVKYPEQKSYRYALPALFCLGLQTVYPHPIFVFFAAGFTIFLILERHFGKLNELALLALILITPTAKYFFDVFSFPIRLFLTKLASKALYLIGYNNQATGNFIEFQEQVFSVGEACAGLRLVLTSFLICLFLTSFFERQNKHYFNWQGILTLLGLTGILVVASNFIRIVTLIIFHAPAETAEHEIIGLVTLAVVVIAPLYWLIPFLAKKQIFENSEHQITNSQSRLLPFQRRDVVRCVSTLPNYLLFAGLISILAYVNAQDIQTTETGDVAIEQIELQGYQKTILPTKVVQFQSDAALVYIKPKTHFFRGDHNPSMCWRGSGYQFFKEQTITINEQEVFFAELVAPNQQHLYTAWWYDNGDERTISQWQWRWQSFRGANPFRVINVTSPHPKLLEEEVGNLLRQKLF